MKSLLVLLLGLLLAGCATQQTTSGYTENQFSSRLEYLRFCNHYELYTGRCLTR